MNGFECKLKTIDFHLNKIKVFEFFFFLASPKSLQPKRDQFFGPPQPSVYDPLAFHFALRIFLPKSQNKGLLQSKIFVINTTKHSACDQVDRKQNA